MMDIKFNCVHCGRSFNRLCACKSHEAWCNASLTKKPNPSNMVKSEHQCSYCGRITITTVSGNKNHELHCVKNPNRLEWKLRRNWNEAERKHLSDMMKTAIKEGRAHGWGNVRENLGGMSYPEKWFSDMLIKNNLMTDYEYNKQFYKYKLDFAWVNRRLCIELDGSQHDTIPGRKQSDNEKDALLHAHGWKVLRLKWGYIRKHTIDAIELVRKFLTGIGDVSVPDYKSRKEIAHERREQCKIDGVKQDKLGRYRRIMITDDEIIRRKKLLLSSGVNLTCHGWVTLASEKTGLSKRVIYQTVERCPELKNVIYRRKLAEHDN